MKKAKKPLKISKSNQLPNEVKCKTEKVASSVRKNVPVAGGVLRGFLLGAASLEGQFHFYCSWVGFFLPSFIRTCQLFFQPAASTFCCEILSVSSSSSL